MFRELISMAQDDQGAVDMLCRVLTSLDEDVITLEVPRCGQLYTSWQGHLTSWSCGALVACICWSAPFAVAAASALHVSQAPD